MAEAHQRRFSTVGGESPSPLSPDSPTVSESDHSRKRKRIRSQGPQHDSPPTQANAEEPSAHHETDTTPDLVTDDVQPSIEAQNDALIREALACLDRVSTNSRIDQLLVNSSWNQLSKLRQSLRAETPVEKLRMSNMTANVQDILRMCTEFDSVMEEWRQKKSRGEDAGDEELDLQSKADAVQSRLDSAGHAMR